MKHLIRQATSVGDLDTATIDERVSLAAVILSPVLTWALEAYFGRETRQHDAHSGLRPDIPT